MLDEKLLPMRTISETQDRIFRVGQLRRGLICLEMHNLGNTEAINVPGLRIELNQESALALLDFLGRNRNVLESLDAQFPKLR